MFAYMKRGRAFYRDVFSLALPIILQNLIMTSLGIIDTFLVGLLGEAHMAAVTVANTPVFVLQLLIFGLQSGSAVMISQYWGHQDRESINRIMGIGIYIAGTVSSLLAAAMLIFPVEIMSFFSNNEELIPLAAEYAQPIGLAYFFYSLMSVYTGANRSMENPGLGMKLFAVSMAVDSFLNWVLIFGKLGAPAMGVRGAAVSTLIGCVVGFVLAFIHAFRNKRFKIVPRLMFLPGKAMTKEFIKYATPVIINETAWGLGMAVYPVIMGYMDSSKEILAAYTIAGNIEKLGTVAVFAVASTASVIVGREIGRGNREEVYEIGAALNTLSFGLGAVTGILMIGVLHAFIVPYVYPLFGLSALAAEIATAMQTIIFAFLAIRATNTTCIVGVLRGGGDVRAAAAIDITPMWVLALPMAALCGLVFKANVIWLIIAMVSDSVVKFGIGVWRFRSKKWINDVTQKTVKRSEV